MPPGLGEARRQTLADRILRDREDDRDFRGVLPDHRGERTEAHEDEPGFAGDHFGCKPLVIRRVAFGVTHRVLDIRALAPAELGEPSGERQPDMHRRICIGS